jgi:glutathione S-transferase
MTMILHEDPRSGNCYKIRLTAAHLGIPLESRSYDVMKAETRTPEFLEQVNANGRIPVLQDGHLLLPESNAACFYLADGSTLIPECRFDRADMLRWMFWEQYNHEPNIATVRFWIAFIGEDKLNDLQRTLLPLKREQGEAALALMDDHLARRDWFAGDRLSLADIGLYAYTRLAGDGGYKLNQYPRVGAWMERIAAHPRHVPMNTETPLAIGSVAD